MKDVECPYCGEAVEINHDDGYGYEEGVSHQQDCPKCDKTFIYTTTITIHHEARKADCLNGAEHQYEQTKCFPPEFARLRCKICDDEKPIEP